jgi:hypothetical protein
MREIDWLKGSAQYYANLLDENPKHRFRADEIKDLIEILDAFASGGFSRKKLHPKEQKILDEFESMHKKIIWHRLVQYDEKHEVSFIEITYAFQRSSFSDGRAKPVLSAAAINKHLKEIRKQIDRKEYDFQISVKKFLVTWQVFRGKGVTRTL